MKKLAVLAIVCCAMVLTSCHRPQEFYNASISEYNFSSQDNETSVKAILGTIYNLWEGDYAYKGLTADVSDLKAKARYNESVAAISLHAEELKPYIDEVNDYFVYTLKRTTNGTDVLLMKTKFYKDTDGSIQHMVTFEHFYGEEVD